MDFAPLKWVAGTLTAWHFGFLIAWAALSGFLRFRRVGFDVGQFPAGPFVMDQLAIVFLYIIGALVLGQLFGDQYSFSQVWPTSLVIGTLVAASFILGVHFTESEPPQIVFQMVAFLFFAAFLGLAFNLLLYVMPRVVGLGLFEFPKASWGVKL